MPNNPGDRNQGNQGNQGGQKGQSTGGRSNEDFGSRNQQTGQRE